MATNRTMKSGDTWPPFKFEAKDETGLVDLTAAVSMRALFKSPAFLIEGVGPTAPTAIDPPEADADGVHFWNAEYDFQAGDTDEVGVYKAELEVNWGDGHIQTFPNSGAPTLTIEEDNG
jgi:hypothetical protein